MKLLVFEYLMRNFSADQVLLGGPYDMGDPDPVSWRLQSIMNKYGRLPVTILVKLLRIGA